MTALPGVRLHDKGAFATILPVGSSGMTSSLRKLENAASDIDKPSRMCFDVREALKQGRWIALDEVQRARALNPLGFKRPRTSNEYH